jgi:SAM-dependent methyltransferase
LWRVLRRCGGCGFVRADLELTHEEVRRLYQADYFRGQEYGDYLADRVSHVRNFEHRYRLMARAAPGVRSLFEVGCAYGFWLDCCSRHGVECAGVDVCDEAVAYAVRELGQQATSRDFLELPLPAGRYQAFCMWDTVEHLAHPERFIARVHDLLPAGGWLFLTTGDIGAPVARLRGRHWRMIHPPTHLQYFSRATMTRLLGRHGFTVASVRSLPMCRNVGEMLGRLSAMGKGLPRRAAGVMARVLPGWVQRRNLWIDLGDIMFVAARKPALAARQAA